MDQGAARPVRLPPKANAVKQLTNTQRDALEHQLHCQCGCTLDVFTCRTTDFSCQVSPAMHRDVMALVDGGYSAQEIIDAFVSTYGERVLMAPPRSGFNILAWVSPGIGPVAFLPSETLDALASFSGAGPRRDGVMKPDLTAPGSAIISTLSTSWPPTGLAGGWRPELLADDGKHAALQGTSMAAPHVTGAIAMMLQQTPTLNPSQVRERLTANTRRDGPVLAAGAVPNKNFGWGKLDLTNVVPNLDLVPPTSRGYGESRQRLAGCSSWDRAPNPTRSTARTAAGT